MISPFVRALCVLSILCGLAQSLTPSGSARSVMKLVCSIVLLAYLVSVIKTLDWEEYALEAAKLRSREQAFLEQCTERRQELDRLVIEREYAAYIRSMAESRGIPLQDVSVRAQWSLDGLWVPCSAVMTGVPEGERREAFSARIEAELGIPRENQEWRMDGE